MRGPIGAVATYWDSMRHTDFFRLYLGLSETDLHRTIPIGMHGDGGAYSHNDSLFVLTWNSLIGVGTTRMTRFLMTVVPKSEMCAETMSTIMAILSWSFNVMLTGIEPLKSWLGDTIPGTKRFLANRWKAALSQVRGDWEFYTMPTVFAFPKWNELGNMCWKCLAVGQNASPLKYSRFDRLAPWRATRQTHESYLALRAIDAVPVLLASVIGFRVELILIDVLHCVDLGVASHIVGNIFWLCIQLHVLGPNIAESLANLNYKMKQWEKDNGIDHKFKGNLTKERIRTSANWPKLKSKAAPMHALATFALILAREHLSEDVILVASLLVEFYTLLKENGMFFTDDKKKQMQSVGSRLCRAYAKLACKAVSERKRMWKVTPKLHLFLHLCEWDVDFGNPRFFWCFADEDLVGQMIKSGESCHPKTLAVASMFKWLTVVFSEQDAK